ncbi:MAG: 16S rRNA methyltransferase [Armatimonadetes bacterium]|nr:16S rRNA methyltransferase [Armatimonadota bacterium]
MNDERATQVTAALLASRKYAPLCPDTLRRVAWWAAERHPALREATKAAKRKLHQVYGAYVSQLDLKRVQERTDALPSSAGKGPFEAACREVLACHASTAERLPFVEELYPALFALTGLPTTVVDLACGLNPFALPWMGLGPEARYLACDIDRRIVTPVSRLLAQAGLAGSAECRDVLVSPPDWEADVAFLLKSAPCLEQQEPGATLRVLRVIRARHMVVSFPAQSLAGRHKGMRDHYAATAARLAGALGASMERLDFPTETFYVLTLPRTRCASGCSARSH